MTFNNLQALSTAAVYVTTGKASDIRAAAFECLTRQLLKSDGVEGKTLRDCIYSKDNTLTVDVRYGEHVLTIQRNITAMHYTIVNIVKR